jgi:hypothetical protein
MSLKANDRLFDSMSALSKQHAELKKPHYEISTITPCNATFIRMR